MNADAYPADELDEGGDDFEGPWEDPEAEWMYHVCRLQALEQQPEKVAVDNAEWPEHSENEQPF